MSGVFHEDIPFVIGRALAAGSTGDKAFLPVPFKCEWVRSMVGWEGTDNNATPAFIAFDRRITMGSDSGRVDGALGVIKHVVSLNQQGKVTYVKPVSGTGKVVLDVGDEIVVEVTQAQGAALAFNAMVVLRRVPETEANQADMVLTA